VEAVERLRVERVARAFAAQQPRQLVGHDVPLVGCDLHGVTTDVRSRDDVFEREQRVVGTRWFDAEDVEGGTCQVLAAQCLGEGFLVDERGACRVHQERAALHARQLLGADQAFRSFAHRGVQAHEIAAREQLFEARGFGPCGQDLLVVEERVVSDHVRAERAQAAGDGAPDRTHADQAHGLSPEFASL